MNWSINEVARVAGVTSRTLRHYDAQGLLKPTWVAPGGRRYYGQSELVRLQQILLLRDLGIGLGTIGQMLEQRGQSGAEQMLLNHRKWLASEVERLQALIKTVDKTLDDLKKGNRVTPATAFNGFAKNPYEKEARERWGDEMVDAANEKMATWSPEEAEKAQRGFDQVHEGIRTKFAEGASPRDPEVQELIKLHHEIVSLHWAPDAAAYQGLGQMYVDDERFAATIGQGDEAAVAFMRDAMKVYADENLS